MYKKFLSPNFNRKELFERLKLGVHLSQISNQKFAYFKSESQSHYLLKELDSIEKDERNGKTKEENIKGFYILFENGNITIKKEYGNDLAILLDKDSLYVERPRFTKYDEIKNDDDKENYKGEEKQLIENNEIGEMGKVYIEGIYMVNGLKKKEEIKEKNKQVEKETIENNDKVKNYRLYTENFQSESIKLNYSNYFSFSDLSAINSLINPIENINYLGFIYSSVLIDDIEKNIKFYLTGFESSNIFEPANNIKNSSSLITPIPNHFDLTSSSLKLELDIKTRRIIRLLEIIIALEKFNFKKDKSSTIYNNPIYNSYSDFFMGKNKINLNRFNESIKMNSGVRIYGNQLVEFLYCLELDFKDKLVDILKNVIEDNSYIELSNIVCNPKEEISKTNLLFRQSFLKRYIY